MKLNKKHLIKTILEVLSTKNSLIDESDCEIEENFGRESQGEVLDEGWEEQWPGELSLLRSKISNIVTRDVFNESLVKIFFKVGDISYIMPIRFIRSTANKIRFYSESGMRLQANKIKTYVKHIEQIKAAPEIDFSQEEKNEQIEEIKNNILSEQEILNQYLALEALADDDFYFGRGRRKEVLRQAKSIQTSNPNDKLPVMRYINKVIKSINKQLTKWSSKNITELRVQMIVDVVLRDLKNNLDSQQHLVYEKTFDEEHVLALIDFIHGIKGDGKSIAQKLADMLKKNKDLPREEYLKQLKLFVQNNKIEQFENCGEGTEGEPCVFLRLDDGMFWHNTQSNYCSTTKTSMANCGAASEEDSILYNLMSTNEDGVRKFHVTLEYNKERNKIFQVLGQANTIPKEKYWPAISKFFKATGDPILDKDAFQHLYNTEHEYDSEESKSVDERIQNFIDGIGVMTKPQAIVSSWEGMKRQIEEGYYAEKLESRATINDDENLFRVSIGGGPSMGSTTWLHLSIVAKFQTVSPEDLPKWRESSGETLERAQKFENSQEYKDFIYKAVSKSRMASETRLNLKYSNIEKPRIRVYSHGSYIMRMRFPFMIDTRGWSEHKGTLLSVRFETLLADTLDALPAQAILAWNEIKLDTNLKESKKKKKLDRKYLSSVILEVLKESSEPEKK